MQMASKLATKSHDKMICPNILIDQSTKNSADSFYQLQFEGIPPIKLKGKAQPVFYILFNRLLHIIHIIQIQLSKIIL